MAAVPATMLALLLATGHLVASMTTGRADPDVTPEPTTTGCGSVRADRSEMLLREKQRLLRRLSMSDPPSGVASGLADDDASSASYSAINTSRWPEMLQRLMHSRHGVDKRSLPDAATTTTVDGPETSTSGATLSVDDDDDYDADNKENVYIIGRLPGRGATTTTTCLTPHGHAASCFEFTMKDMKPMERIALWFYYRTPVSWPLVNRTLDVYQLHRHGTGPSRSSPLASVEATGVDGWLRADLTSHLRNRTRDRHGRLAVRIQWRDVGLTSTPTSNSFEKRPFLDVRLQRQPSDPASSAAVAVGRRPASDKRRRSHDYGQLRHCAKYELYVNFTELGWNQFIVHPAGYYSGFCLGACPPGSNTNLGGIIKERLNIANCCTPVAPMRTLNIVFVEKVSGSTICYSKPLENFIVDHCGCR